MTRVPEITRREQLPEADRVHFDAIHAPRGAITAPYRYLLHAPALAARMAHLTSYSRFDGDQAFPEDVKELAICTAARELDCAYEWADHEPRALAAGVRGGAIDILRSRRDPAGLEAHEEQVVRYVQELLRPPHRISEPVFAAMRERLGVPGLVELTGILGSYVALSCVFNAFEIAPEPGKPVLPV